MSVATAVRKPLGVRATPEQHRVLTKAAAREHRSVASFVLAAALKAAGEDGQYVQRGEQMNQALRRAQELMKSHRQAGRSMAAELIAERRAAADSE